MKLRLQRPARLWFALWLALPLVSCPAPTTMTSARSTNQAVARVLVFSKTAGFRHDSIPDGITAVRQLGQQNGFDVEATEDASAFNDANLSRFQAIVFLSTTGDILNDAQQAAFERYQRNGGGFVGMHSATDTEYGWAWYGGLVGAYFQTHPAVQRARLKIEDAAHPSTSMLPATWERTDEWYDFRQNPRGRVKVLASLDESSYSGGGMGTDHPISWCQIYGGGRSWYTAGGHTKESYGEPLFRQHLLGGIQFAAKLKDGACAALSVTSAASYRGESLAGESIASLFGAALATTTQAASATPLPTSLAGTSIRIKDSAGLERLAPLFFVSPTQINFLVPAGLSNGTGTLTVVKADATAPGTVAQLARVTPAVFAANSNGQGAAAGLLLVRTGATEQYVPLAVNDAQTNTFVPNPLEISDTRSEYFLILFGTGIRGRTSLNAVQAELGGLLLPVSYAGAQPEFAGLDQINLSLPRTAAGRGEVELALTVEGVAANRLRLRLK